MAPLVLPSYWTMRIKSGLVLPCSPGSLSNAGGGGGGTQNDETERGEAECEQNRMRFMGNLRPGFDGRLRAKDLRMSARVALT